MDLRSQNPESLAQDFWSGTGLESQFPRDIERVVVMKLSLSLVELPALTVPIVKTWLAEKQLALSLPLYHHDLLGCLVAHRGHGFLFVCSADSADERRLTIAHEVAHFLMDYLWPRRQVIQALGESITEVLDGVRRATSAERVVAVLSRIRVGAHIHLLPRPGTDEDTIIARTEARADRLALELVAPQEQIRSFLLTLPACEALPVHEVCAALAAHFGLPAYAFASVVRPRREPRPLSFLEDVRAALRRRR
jgi:hypothetical protein